MDCACVREKPNLNASHKVLIWKSSFFVRDIEMNKMSSIYGGSLTSGGEYAGLTEMLADPVEEEVRKSYYSLFSQLAEGHTLW